MTIRVGIIRAVSRVETLPCIRSPRSPGRAHVRVSTCLYLVPGDSDHYGHVLAECPYTDVEQAENPGTHLIVNGDIGHLLAPCCPHMLSISHNDYQVAPMLIAVLTLDNLGKFDIDLTEMTTKLPSRYSTVNRRGRGLPAPCDTSQRTLNDKQRVSKFHAVSWKDGWPCVLPSSVVATTRSSFQQVPGES